MATTLPIESKMKVTVIDPNNGLRKFDKVNLVRILDQKYRILIMEDYSPTIGEVNGKVVVVTDDNEYRFDDIHGFYKNQNNDFFLLIDRF